MQRGTKASASWAPTARPIGRVRPRRGFTLAESLAAIIILGVVAATITPVMYAMGDNARVAERTRRAAEGAAFAVERVLRLVRECPAGATPGSVAIAFASASSLTLADGRGVELSGTDLMWRSGLDSEPMVRGVEEFELRLLASDGRTSTLATPGSTQRVEVRIVVDGFELSGAALIRARINEP